MNLDGKDKDVELIAKAIDIAIDHLGKASDATYLAYGWHAANPINELRIELKHLQKRHFNTEET